jgi:hypothetical protein
VISYIGCLVTSMVWVPVSTRMVKLAGVKSGNDAGQVPEAEVQVLLLVDPSGAVTTMVIGVRAGAPVTSMNKPVQPIAVQTLGPTTLHPEPKAATNTRVIANAQREIVTDRIPRVTRAGVTFRTWRIMTRRLKKKSSRDANFPQPHSQLHHSKRYALWPASL